MPSFTKYKDRLESRGKTLGEVRKREADKIIEATWYGDIATRTCYLFDMYHDPDPRLLRNMKVTDEMIPMDIKFVKHTSKTYDKDNVTMHLQMKPSQEKCVPYYEEYEYLYDKEAWKTLSSTLEGCKYIAEVKHYMNGIAMCLLDYHQTMDNNARNYCIEQLDHASLDDNYRPRYQEWRAKNVF